MMDNISNTRGMQETPDKDILALSRRIIDQNREAYEELTNDVRRSPMIKLVVPQET